MKIRALFLKIKNIDGDLYATVKILSPKTIDFEGCKLDTQRISEHSKSHPIYVGKEQGSYNKDSLYVGRGEERTWTNGHRGYFEIDDKDIYDCLTQEEKAKYHLENMEFWEVFPVSKYKDEHSMFGIVTTKKGVDIICNAKNSDIKRVYELRKEHREDISKYATEYEIELSKNIKKFLIEEADGTVVERDEKYFDILPPYRETDFSKPRWTEG